MIADIDHTFAPKILLADTERSSSAALLAVGLWKAGCEVSAACQTRRHPLAYTRSPVKIFPYSSLRPIESLIKAMTAANPEIIIPCDDRAVGHLHELHKCTGNRLIALIERSLGSPGSYSVVSSRDKLLRLAGEEGLQVPDTMLVKDAEDLKRWQREHEFPWVFKSDGTYGGRGVKIAYSPQQAKSIFSQMNRPHRTSRVVKRLIVNRDPFWLRPWWKRFRPAIIVQAYVQGRPANCGVFCWKGRILAFIGVEAIRWEGSTGPATIVRVIDNASMRLAAEKIAHRLDLSGFFGLDFMIEHATGEAYLIEMNPRCTPLSHLQLGEGRDLIGALWAQLSGRPCRKVRPVTEREMIAYFPKASIEGRELLEVCFQDVPYDEPDLLRELLSPWPERTFLFRLASKKAISADKCSQHEKR